MKRLIKKAELPLEEIIPNISQWIIGDGMAVDKYNQFFDTLIKEYPDCCVNVNAYRVIQIDDDEVTEAIKEIVKKSNIDEDEKEEILEEDYLEINELEELDIDNNELIKNEFKKFIYNDNRYCSWSETINGYETVKNDFKESFGYVQIGIRANITGFSIYRLIEKLDIEDKLEGVDSMSDQEEIIAKMPNDYTIIEIGNIEL